MVTKKRQAKATDTKTEYFMGIELHKKFMQVAVMDHDGTLQCNERIECDYDVIRIAFSKMSQNSKYVLESSSVWYGMYRFLTNELGLDVMLSNPLATKRIAQSKKKTDKVDAGFLCKHPRFHKNQTLSVPWMVFADVMQRRTRRTRLIGIVCGSLENRSYKYGGVFTNHESYKMIGKNIDSWSHNRDLSESSRHVSGRVLDWHGLNHGGCGS